MKLTELLQDFLKLRSAEDKFYDALREKVKAHHGMQRDMADEFKMSKQLVHYYVFVAKAIPDNFATYIINYKK